MDTTEIREPRWAHPQGPGGWPRGWRTTWTLKQFLGEETDSASVAAAARGIHEAIERLRKTSFGGRWADEYGDNPAAYEIWEVSDEFHTIGFVDGDENADCDHFNAVMNALYDWADAERVIIK